MGSGIRFFDIDYASKAFLNTTSVSSNSGLKDFPFDNNKLTRWVSTGENNDATTSSITILFSSTRVIDTLYVYGTNAKTYDVKYYNGSTWQSVTGLVSNVSNYYEYQLHTFSALQVQGIKYEMNQTVIANSEKQVTNMTAHLSIGQLEGYPNISPTIKYEQFKQKLLNGKYFIINRGEAFECKLDLNHYQNSSDISIIENLKERGKEFWVLLNGGNETQFTNLVKPYRLKDMYKVAIIDNFDSKYTGNYYKAGTNTSVSLVEVA